MYKTVVVADKAFKW